MRNHLLLAGLALAAITGSATPASAAKLLYRAYNNDNQLYGAMLFDTNKPYTVDAVYTVRINATVFSTAPANLPPDTYLGVNGLTDRTEFRAKDYTASGSLAFGAMRPGYNIPADSQLFQINANGSIRFDTGTYHVYSQPTYDNQPASDYKILGRVVATDVTDKTVDIIAQAGADRQLQFLAIAYGDKPPTTPLANGGFAFTNFEGSVFNKGTPSALTRLEFGAPGRNQEGPAVITNGTSFRNINLFTGSNTDPNIYWFMDPTDPHPLKDGLDDVTGNRLFLTQSPAQIVAPGVPEPAGWALMMVGFGGAGASLRRNRRRRSARLTKARA